MAATEGLDFTVELKVAANLRVVEDSKAIDHGQRATRECPHGVGVYFPAKRGKPCS